MPANNTLRFNKKKKKENKEKTYQYWASPVKFFTAILLSVKTEIYKRSVLNHSISPQVLFWMNNRVFLISVIILESSR